MNAEEMSKDRGATRSTTTTNVPKIKSDIAGMGVRQENI